MLIRPIRLDLITLQFRVLQGRRQANRLPLRIHFLRDLKPLLPRVAKQFLHHLDDVIVRMVIVIPQNDVVSRLPLGRLFLWLGLLLLLRLGDGHIGFRRGFICAHGPSSITTRRIILSRTPEA